jgi:putative N6-adenine-specific DNA methylase
MSELNTYIAKTYAGFENILQKELFSLGAEQPEVMVRAVRFKADVPTFYNILYKTRLALRVLQEIGFKRIRNKKELYDFMYDQPWHQIFPIRKNFAIDCTLNSDLFNHSHYVSLLMKDAIVDRFRKEEGYRPDVEPKYPDVRIQGHLSRNNFSLLLDAAGEPLFKRGYRKRAIEAPLSEVLAAGLVELSGWKPDQPFVDPMCGSGTLIAEALMKSMNMPSGFFRDEFAVMNWSSFEQETWDEVVEKARDEVFEPESYFQASDKSPLAVRSARTNLAVFESDDAVSISVRPVQELTPVWENGVLITNPPYGERLQPEKLDELYSALGDTLKKEFAGYTAWVFSGYIPGLKKIGLRTSERLHLKNGPIDCRYHKYELFRGSAKDSKAQEQDD